MTCGWAFEVEAGPDETIDEVVASTGARGRTGGPGADDKARPGTTDRVVPHPTYGELGWVAVVDPGERTRVRVLALLQAAHAEALARWRRRHDEDRTSG